MINNKRRKVLKGLLYGSIVSTSSFSPFALSAQNATQKNKSIALLASDISILRETVAGKEQITFINNTDRSIPLNAEQPVSIVFINGLMSVNANIDFNSGLFLQAKQSLKFEIEAYNVEQLFSSLHINATNIDQQSHFHLNINSELYAFNGVVPVSSLNLSSAA